MICNCIITVLKHVHVYLRCHLIEATRELQRTALNKETAIVRTTATERTTKATATALQRYIPRTNSSKSSPTIHRDIELQWLSSCFDRAIACQQEGDLRVFTSVRSVWQDPQKTIWSQHISYMRNYENVCMYLHFISVLLLYMLRTDCQPDRFINRPPVCNPVGLLLINVSK